MTVSILVVDDESDVSELFRQQFRREVRQGTYAMHFANSGEEALGKLAGGIAPTLVVILSDDERRCKASVLGALDFLTKPVDFDRLKEQLRQLPTAAD
jgi:DNA-binding NtrC family response regulator